MSAATVSGVVKDMNGNVLATAAGQMCGPVDGESVEACLGVTVNDDGTFTAGALKPGLFNLKFVHPPVDGRTFSGQALQISLADGDEITLEDDYVVPEADAMTDLEGAAATDVAIDGTLTVSIDPELTNFGLGVAAELGGTRMSEDLWPYADIEGNSVLALYAFSTSSSTASTCSSSTSSSSTSSLSMGFSVKSASLCTLSVPSPDAFRCGAAARII